MAYDILIKGGRIYDGSGLPSYLGDVAVQNGKIVETGRISGSAKRVVHADGLAVSPGFIDFHTHLDAQLLWDPLATSSCYHGVTTVIPGNCALSLAPCKEPDRDTILKSFERVEAITLPALKSGVKWGFTTFGQYLDALRGNLGVNVASLVGHCALRQFVMGDASIERAATPAEIQQMKDVLKASVRAGAAGFSTNQNPVHMYANGTPIQSRFATDEEIIEIACALGEINQGVVQISRGSLGVSVPIPPICAPIALRHSARSTTSGSRAAFSITVVPSASVAAIIRFSVPVTVTISMTIRAPFKRLVRARI